MALDPRLMMVDYSPIQKAAETFTTGMQNRRMKQVEGLAGQALMGDPSAMENLSQLDPMIAAKVQSQLGEQQASQQQAKYQQEQEFAEQQKDFFKMGSKAKDVQELNKLASFSFKQGLHPAIRRKMQEEGITEFDADDLLAIKMYDAMQGGSGLGGMELDKLVDLYNKNPVVEDMLKAKNGVMGIKNAYQRYKENPTDQAASFNVAKSAISMVEAGVVRPEEFAAAAGLKLPSGLSYEDAMAQIYNVLSGNLSQTQVTNLARMGLGAYNAKVENAISLQNNLKSVGLGNHKPEEVFAFGKAEMLEDFTQQQEEIIPKVLQGQISNDEVREYMKEFNLSWNQALKELQKVASGE